MVSQASTSARGFILRRRSAVAWCPNPWNSILYPKKSEGPYRLDHGAQTSSRRIAGENVPSRVCLFLSRQECPAHARARTCSSGKTLPVRKAVLVLSALASLRDRGGPSSENPSALCREDNDWEEGGATAPWSHPQRPVYSQALGKQDVRLLQSRREAILTVGVGRALPASGVSRHGMNCRRAWAPRAQVSWQGICPHRRERCCCARRGSSTPAVTQGDHGRSSDECLN